MIFFPLIDYIDCLPPNWDVHIDDKVEGATENIKQTDEKVLSEMKLSYTNNKNDHHDDSEEDINNNKTNYSNDSSYREDIGTNDIMEEKREHHLILMTRIITMMIVRKTLIIIKLIIQMIPCFVKITVLIIQWKQR